MSSRRFRQRHRETAEINITAFMNLMVILVPFLLITAVFSRLAVLELNLPTSQGESNSEPPQEMMLEITVRDELIEVGDRNGGLLTSIDSTSDGHDLGKLTEFLKRVKEQFPEKTDATLLLEPDTSYEVLVQVMDAVRVVEQTRDEQLVKAELFPEIAIGDAPMLN
jgi:biopolymer transport protein ExbD